MDTSFSDDDSASDGSMGFERDDDSACSTPFVSASSSPAHDGDGDPSFSAAFVSTPLCPARDPSFSAASWFRSVPVSPARGGGSPGTANVYGRELGFDFDFGLSRCSPSRAAAAMSSADELFDNGQIRPRRLASLLLRPHSQALQPLDEDVPPPRQPSSPLAGADDERGRLRDRSSRRRYRSLSPFRARWLSPAPDPATGEAEADAAQSALQPSSSTSSSSSSSRSYYRKWRFLKNMLRRSKSSGGGSEHPRLPTNPSPPPAPKRSPSPSPTPRDRGRARRSAHARMYESRRAEAEEMRRRTFLPYRHGLPLLAYLGLGSRVGYFAMHGFVAAGKPRP